MAKEIKKIVKEESDIIGYTWASGKKEPIYAKDNTPKQYADGDIIGYTWASGKKEPIKK